MNAEWEEELNELLFKKEKTIGTFEEVNTIYKKVEGYLLNFPFEKYPYPGYEALEFVCQKYENINTVLDIGCGEGYQSKEFLRKGKKVTAIDYGKSGRITLCEENENFQLIIGDFNNILVGDKYDCVWAAHVLEHQLNPHLFLRKVVDCVDEGGIIAITVPPYKAEIIGGHVSLWNAGLLLYHLILAGCDCSNAHVKKYGYNISVVVEKKSIEPFNVVTYDVGDIKKLRQFFPKEIRFYEEYLHRDTPFDGNILELNWK